MIQYVRPALFVLLKASAACFSLVFQYLAVKSFGNEGTGVLNSLHLYALTISTLLLIPGAETALLRALPAMRLRSPQQYLAAKRWVALALIIPLAVCFLLSLITGVGWWPSQGTASVVVSLSVLAFASRILPMVLRIDGKYFWSILTEPSMLFGVGCFFLWLFPHAAHSCSPSQFWSLVAWVMACIMIGSPLLILWEVGRVVGVEKKATFMELMSGYGTAVALIPLSNFAMLWGLTTAGTLVLSSEEIAKCVTLMRFVGLLLFAEGTLAAYYLPQFAASQSRQELQSKVASFRRILVAGTIVGAIAMVAGATSLQTFGLGRAEISCLIVFSIVQLYVSLRASPFSVATLSLSRERLAPICWITILASAAVACALFLWKDWRIVIGGFSFLQLLRTALADFALKQNSQFSFDGQRK